MRTLILIVTLAVGLHFAGAAQAPTAAMHLEKYESAMKAAADAELQGDSARALGNRRAAEEHLQDARTAYENAGAAMNDDLAVMSGYAEVLNMLGDHDLAARALERAVDLHPDDPMLWARLGANRAGVGEAMRDSAFDALHRSLELNPEPDVMLIAQRTLGDLYWETGLYSFAEEAYAAALAAAPEDTASRIWQAVLQVRLGDILTASNTLDALGRSAQPYDVETRMRLRRALRDFEFYRLSYSDEPVMHGAFGKLLYRAARIPEAIVAIEHALDLAPDQPDLWNFLAAMRTQMGDAAGSIEAYTKSLEHNPDQPNVERAIEQTRQVLRAQQQQPGLTAPPSQPDGEASSIPPLLRAPE
jgi:tetratricopeptide (TPR) repeat protein